MNRVKTLYDKKTAKEKPQKALYEYPRNDAGTAQAFADRYAEKVRFSPGIGWLVWNGCRWERDEAGKVNQYAIELSREAQVEAATIEDEDQRRRATSHALNIGNKQKIVAALSLAEGNQALHVSPAELDSDPFLVGCTNGTIDLKSGTFHESDRDDLITLTLGTGWENSATCPQWEKFLRDVTKEDPELIEFIRLSIGYTLTGSVNEQRFYFLYGIGANGKSVLVETIEALLGDYVHRASAELFDRRRDRNKDPELAELPGKRLILASETQEGARLDERLIKDVTGGETLRGEAKYQSGIRFSPTAKIWMSGNHKPGISGTDQGIWRRVHLLPFDARFNGKNRDPQMGEKLRTELPGILRWAVSGCLDWQKGGIKIPERVRLAVQEYRSDEDTVGRFVKDRIEEAASEATVSKKVVYAAYKEWSEEEGHKFHLTSNRLTRRLKEHGFHDEEKVWRGIRIKED